MSASLLLRRFPTAVLVYFSLLAATAAPTAEGPEFFANELLPILEKAQCRQCHNDNGIASRTRLHFPDAEADAGRIETFGLSLRSLIEPQQLDQSLLLRKPTQRIPHTGGQRIVPGSPEEQVLLAWIDYLARQPADKGATGGSDAAHPEGDVRRLTHSQYNNTVHDLLGDQTQPADQFPQEDVIHGYRNQIEGQNIPPLLAEAYNRAAERLARNAFRGGDHQSLIPCRPASADNAECRNAFIAGFGQKAFRRPLAQSEIDTYARLFTLAAGRGEFIDGARIVVETMLQSPSFLFYAEPSPPAELRPYQIASLLSYFLWDTLPDQALFDAAANGRLDSNADVEKQIRRMLKDPRAREALDQFLAQWLRFDRVETAVRDRRLYPEFTAELVGSMLEETRLLFNGIVWEDRDFTEFFSAEYSFLDTSLAHLYGLQPPPSEFQKVSLPPDSGRAGILGQATFLTVTSKPADTSPTERGLFVRQHFLCQTVPPPPPGVDTTLPALSDDRPMTVRGRLAVHLSNPACAGCHRLVDGIGFGFERYDAVGRFRNEEIVKIFPTQDELRRNVKTEPSEYKLPIDPSASVYGLPGSEFSTPSELGRYLARDEGCQRCIVKQLFRYAVGRLENDSDQSSIDAAFERFRDSRFRLQELIIAIAASESFLGKSES